MMALNIPKIGLIFPIVFALGMSSSHCLAAENNENSSNNNDALQIINTSNSSQLLSLMGTDNNFDISIGRAWDLFTTVTINNIPFLFVDTNLNFETVDLNLTDFNVVVLGNIQSKGNLVINALDLYSFGDLISTHGSILLSTNGICALAAGSQVDAAGELSISGDRGVDLNLFPFDDRRLIAMQMNLALQNRDFRSILLMITDCISTSAESVKTIENSKK